MLRCKRFLSNAWNNDLISVNQLLFVNGDFYDSNCIELPSNELAEVSLEDMRKLRKEWDRLEKNLPRKDGYSFLCFGGL
jgi:hypothetical protein